MTNTRPVPSTVAPIAEVKGTKVFLIAPWLQFFQQFVQKAAAAVDITLTGSPFSYTPNQLGNVYVNGGAVSNISLIRGSAILNVTSEKLIPTSIGDTIEITYTIAPTVKFLGN